MNFEKILCCTFEFKSSHAKSDSSILKFYTQYNCKKFILLIEADGELKQIVNRSYHTICHMDGSDDGRDDGGGGDDDGDGDGPF